MCANQPWPNGLSVIYHPSHLHDTQVGVIQTPICTAPAAAMGRGLFALAKMAAGAWAAPFSGRIVLVEEALADDGALMPRGSAAVMLCQSVSSPHVSSYLQALVLPLEKNSVPSRRSRTGFVACKGRCDLLQVVCSGAKGLRPRQAHD